MKIGILAIVSPGNGGVYQYAQTLIQGLLEYGEHEFFIIKNKTFVLPAIKRADYHIIPFEDIRPVGVWSGIKERLFVNLSFVRGLMSVCPEYRKIRSLRLDLILCPIVSSIPFFIGTPYCVLISDLQHKYYPDFFIRDELNARNYHYPLAARHAKQILCESHCVKKDIQKFLHVRQEKIHVIIPPPFKGPIRELLNEGKIRDVRNHYKLPEKFLFYPAQLWPHKNHLRLIESISWLKKRRGEKIPLVCVGSKQNNFERMMQSIKTNDLEDQIIYLGYVPEEDMVCLYRLSTALVMPTLFESISLPIGEAFSLGIPVISSNVCALPEQVGDAGLLFDPLNIEDMAGKILQVWQDQELRKSLADRGYRRMEGMTLKNFAKQWGDVINLS